MAGKFLGPAGVDLENMFVSDYAMIDEYASTGSLWLFGNNSYGQLGNNNAAVMGYSPVQTISAGTNWKQVAGGKHHTAAIKTDGTLWTWGYNPYGQLGNNAITSRSSPVQTVSGGTNWKEVSCGGDQTAAIKTDGSLWLWGYNNYGNLGDGTTVNKSSPVQTVSGGTNWKEVSCGNFSHIAAIKIDGTLWTWGNGSHGELGNNANTNRSSPVQTVSGGTNWKEVSCGGYHTAAIKTDGTLWTWGNGSQGQLGDNTATAKSSPVQTVSGGTNWKQVSCGNSTSAAIKTDGTLWLWGLNNQGQLGDNTTTIRSSPVQTVAGGTNWKLVSVTKRFSSMAVKADGTLWGWGYGGNGEIGSAGGTSSSPVQTVAGGTNWKLVSGGQYHTAAVKFYDAGNL